MRGGRGNLRPMAAAALVALATLLAIAAPAAAERVRIVRDSHGEPHIQARSAAGAAYGFGYAQMEDQGTYILGAIAAATGRSAEIIGPDCQPSLQACFTKDQAAHLFRVPETAYDKFAGLPRDTRERLERFAQGLNRYVADHPDQVPGWAFHINPEDVLAYGSYGFVMSQAAGAAGGGGGGGDGLDRALEDAAAEYGARGASNMFALAPSRTASGKSILEGDPHLGFEGANQWYAAQVKYPGTSVAGVTFRGFPGIAIGSNGDVAWSHTANHGNQNESEAYIEQLQPGNPDSYLYGGSYRPMEIRTVPIRVQATAGTVSTVDVRFRYTIHGPVISDPVALVSGSQGAPGGGVARSATVSSYEQVGIATQLFAENDADSLDEFRAALAHNQLSGFNVIAADAEHIFFTPGGRNGILNPGLPLNGALDGTDPYQSWQGILPFDQVPQATDPPSGYYQNANNSPWYTAPDQIKPADVPYYLAGSNGNGPRSRRQTALLDPASNVTLAQAGELAMDNFVEISPSLKSLLAAATPGGGPEVGAANALISAWDGRAEAESTAYPLFTTWVRGLDESALGFKVANPPSPQTAWNAAQITEARQAMVRAHNGMVAQYGTIAVPYGDLHTFTWGDFTAPVNGGDDGAVATVRMTNCKGEAGSQSPDYYHPCHVRGGSSFMFHTDLADGTKMPVTRPVSDTDDPTSPFYTLNARDYVADRYRDFPLTDKAVEEERTSQRRLRVPGTKPPAVRVRSHRARVSAGGRVSFRVTCGARKGERCRGGLVLTTTGKRRDGAERAGRGGRTLARGHFNLRRGKGRVRARLRAPARRALARDGRLAARLKLTVRERDDVRHTSARVKLRG